MMVEVAAKFNYKSLSVFINSGIHFSVMMKVLGRIVLMLSLAAFGASHAQVIITSKTIRQKVDHKVWDSLLRTHVNENGRVDYEGFLKDSVKLHAYLHSLSNNPPETHWSKSEKLAYYINTYNAYTVALILRDYPIKSIKDISNPWSKKFIPIDGQNYSLNNIEHGILRKMDEPRIHFAVNCASISCPKLLNKAYIPEQLEEQLDMVTKAFINGPENEIQAKEVALSKIFKWYRGDFEVDGKNDLLGFINRFSNVAIHEEAKISFKEYNWQLNIQEE